MKAHLTFVVGLVAGGLLATAGAVRLEAQLGPYINAGGLARGSIRIPASQYLNFGTTAGTSGYGLRDNAGTLELKGSGGSWASALYSGGPGGTPTAPFVLTNATGLPAASVLAGTFGDGSYAINIGASGNRTFLSALTTDNGAVANFNFAVGQTTNAGDGARSDHVFTVGYNTAPLGGRAVLTEPAFEWRIEDYYKPAGTAYIEAHWQYYDALGNGYRPIALQIDRSDGGYLTNATTELRASTLTYSAMNGTSYVNFQQGQMALLGSSVLTFDVNAASAIKQRNAAGSTLLDIIHLSSADQPIIG